MNGVFAIRKTIITHSSFVKCYFYDEVCINNKAAEAIICFKNVVAGRGFYHLIRT